MEREGLVERAAKMGAVLGDRLHAELDDHPAVIDVRGRGMFYGIELNIPQHAGGRRGPARAMCGCTRPDPVPCPSAVMIAPPFVITDDEIDHVVDDAEGVARRRHHSMRRVAAIAVALLGVLACLLGRRVHALAAVSAPTTEAVTPRRRDAHRRRRRRQRPRADTTPRRPRRRADHDRRVFDGCRTRGGVGAGDSSQRLHVCRRQPVQLLDPPWDPAKVVFFLQGGGACFDPATCAFDGGSYG